MAEGVTLIREGIFEILKMIYIAYICAILGALIFTIYKLKQRKTLYIAIDNLPFLLLLTIGLHGVLMLPYLDMFASTEPWFFTTSYCTAIFASAAGFEVAAKLAKRFSSRMVASPHLPERVPNLVLFFPALLLILVMSALFLMRYYQSLGTVNPVAGIRQLFSGENTASMMWATTGAEMWGSARGTGGGEGGVIGYFLRWFSLLPLFVLPFLGRRGIWVFGVPFLLSKFLSITAAYAARTTFVTWAGVMAYYFNRDIRRFKWVEVTVLIFAGFVVILVLHMARLGDINARDLTDVSALVSGVDRAIVDTFEPAGWCFRAYEALGHYEIRQIFDHLVSYFGALIPRVIWPSKPFYAFEPDLTMLLTGADISAANPVRTFTVIAEGILLAGLPGVFIVCFAYACFASFLDRIMANYWEYTFVRFWWILTTVILFRTSFFTLFSAGFVLGLLPIFAIGFVVRKAILNTEDAREASRRGAGVRGPVPMRR